MKSDSIWFAWLSVSAVKVFGCVELGVLGVVALFFPGPMDCGQQSLLCSAISHMADVAYVASISSFPMAAAMAYAGALIGSLIFGVAVCFAKVDMEKLRDAARSKSPTSRAIYFFAALIFLMVPYLLELRVSAGQFSFWFFEAVSKERLFLLLWVVGVFILFCAFWMWVLFEATNFVKIILKWVIN